MKRWTIILLVLVLTGFLQTLPDPLGAQVPVTVIVDGVTLPAGSGQIINNRTLVGLRALGDAIGYTVTWDPVGRVATLTRPAPIPTPTVTPTTPPTPGPTPSPVPTRTVTPTITPTSPPSPTVTPTASPSPIPTRTVTVTPTVVPTASPTPGPTPIPGACLPWSLASTWTELGHVPTTSDAVTIPAGRTVCFTPGAVAGSLTVDGVLSNVDGADLRVGNVIVTGRLNLTNTAVITILAPLAGAYVGGGDAPVASDVGLWVTHGGQFTSQGIIKTPWTRLTGAVSAGASTIQVQAATNWRVGDDISVVPTEPPSVAGFDDHFDERTIAAISGTTVTLNAPLSFNHPAVTVRRPDGSSFTYTAEVANLSRSIVIRGQPGTRLANGECPDCRYAHIWIMNDRPVRHTINYTEVRYMGPQRFISGDAPPPGQLAPALGRYPLHFHRNVTFSIGSIVDGAVVRDSGSHAEVSHDSDGITWSNGVMYRIYDDANWWDNAASGCETCNSSTGPQGLQMLNNLVARQFFVPSFRGFIMAGFFVGARPGNVYRGNVVVGNLGNGGGSGFHWPEMSHAVAIFDQGNLSHNNRGDGIFSWQNDDLLHVVRDFTAYHNRWYGIEHGAYLNCYIYDGLTLHGNGEAGLDLHAQSHRDCGNGPMRFLNVSIDAGGRPFGIKTDSHALDAEVPMLLRNMTISGATQACIGVTTPPESSGSGFDRIDVDSTVSCVGNKYWFNSDIPAGSQIIDRASQQILRRADQPGTFVAAWNARVSPCGCGAQPSTFRGKMNVSRPQPRHLGHGDAIAPRPGGPRVIRKPTDPFQAPHLYKPKPPVKKTPKKPVKHATAAPGIRPTWPAWRPD